MQLLTITVGCYEEYINNVRIHKDKAFVVVLCAFTEQVKYSYMIQIPHCILNGSCIKFKFDVSK